ncbi:MAG: hypothetical protein QF898_06560 [SAR202 cluster bacterium]|nr:hypothetical protein [SAR202 cluster bacterium]
MTHGPSFRVFCDTHANPIEPPSSTPSLYLLTDSTVERGTIFEKVAFVDGSERVMRQHLDSDYMTFRVDGDQVLLAGRDSFDLFRIIDQALEPISSYFTDMVIGDFETCNGMLYLLVSGTDGAAFQIVDMNQDGGELPEVVAEVDMIKAGHDLAMNGNDAYILDNVIFRFYLGIVDISDYRRPVAKWAKVGTISYGLIVQDVAERWFVLDSTNVSADRSFARPDLLEALRNDERFPDQKILRINVLNPSPPPKFEADLFLDVDQLVEPSALPYWNLTITDIFAQGYDLILLGSHPESFVSLVRFNPSDPNDVEY